MMSGNVASSKEIASKRTLQVLHLTVADKDVIVAVKECFPPAFALLNWLDVTGSRLLVSP